MHLKWRKVKYQKDVTFMAHPIYLLYDLRRSEAMKGVMLSRQFVFVKLITQKIMSVLRQALCIR